MIRKTDGSQASVAEYQQRMWLLWLLPLVFLAFFFFYPLLAVFRVGVFPPPGLPSTAITLDDLWRPLRFTIFQAILSTGLTLLAGLPFAYLFSHYEFPGKSFLRVLTTIPFILPTVVVAAAFNALIGPRGWLNLLLMGWFHLSTPPVNLLNTLWAILLAHVFYNTTIVIRIVGNAWSHMDSRLEYAASVLGANPWRRWWEVTFALLRPSILAAALMVFIFDFTSFGVILLLGGPRYATLEVDIYTQALQMLNLRAASLLSVLQLVCTLGLTVLYSRLSTRAVVTVKPRAASETALHPRTPRQKIMVGFLVGVLMILLVSPLAALAVRSVTRLDANRGESGTTNSGVTAQYYAELFYNRRQSLFYVPPVMAVRNSLFYAGATVVISLLLGSLASYALTRPSRANRWLDPLLMLPLGTSAVTLGLGFIIVFNRPPLDIRNFPLLIPIAHSLVALPFVVRSLQPALASIPKQLRQAAVVLGASPWQVWREVDFPIVARAFAVSAIFAFTISLGEFGATSFLSRPEYPTMPVAIYRFLSQPGALNYGQALAMSTILMFVCSLGIVLIERLRIPGTGDF